MSTKPDQLQGTTTGSYRPVLAMVDDGFDLTNDDIYPNMFINIDEIPQAILTAVGNTNGDTVIDWHDLDNYPPGLPDGVITFADLDATNTLCATPGKCAVTATNVACAGTPCTPLDLVSGAGRPDPSAKTCGNGPTATCSSNGATCALNADCCSNACDSTMHCAPMAHGWEDGVDGNGTTNCNGFIDDIVGWNFGCEVPTVEGVSGCNLVNAKPVGNVGSPPFLSHGTTTTSIAAAVGGNGVRTAGVSWQARILPIQLAPADTFITTTGAYATLRDSMYVGFLYATLMRADVLNASLASYLLLDSVTINTMTGPATTCPNDPTIVLPAVSKTGTFNDLADQLQKELADLEFGFAFNNTLVVLAAGNCALSLDDPTKVIAYPTSMVGKNVLRVASVQTTITTQDQLSTFSNSGATSVDIAAPGEFFGESFVRPAINSTFVFDSLSFACPDNPNWGHIGCAGTSFSAPMVAGAAALLIAHDTSLQGHPCSIADQLLRNAKPVASLVGTVGPAGRRLDVKNAVLDTQTAPILSCP